MAAGECEPILTHSVQAHYPPKPQGPDYSRQFCLSPMLLIDRYILRIYFRVLAICMVSFCGMFIVADAFNNLEEFLTEGEAAGGLLPVLWGYYRARALTFLDLTGGLLALMAAVFTVTALQRHRELTALLAGGVPSVRVAAPLIAASAVVAGLGVVNREAWIPRFRDTLSRNAQNLDGTQPQPLEARYDHQTSIYLNGSQAFVKDRRIANPSFRLPKSLRHVGRKLIGENAYHKDATDAIPAGFLIDGLSHPMELLAKPSVALDGQPVILTPVDTPWLSAGQCFVVSDIDFQQLSSSAEWLEYSSLRDLVQALYNPSLHYGADVRVAIHSRLMQPVLDVLLVLIGLPIVMSRRGQNVFVAVGKCILLVLVFWIVVTGSQQAGETSLIRPALAAWLPLFFLAPAAVYYLHSLWE